MLDSIDKNLHSLDIDSFRNDLISWYMLEKRDLPWRKDQDPYKVWVSEIMLQQTRVDTVIPYFLAFTDKFPTIEALASADEEDVLKAWEGLGYYSRVRNLHSAVKEVVSSYGGIVPDTPEEISKLKGVGPYTKGAILSIAYNVPEPAVDGNVMRVMSRILSIWEDIAKPKTRTIFEKILYEVISKEHPSEFNQALMELGAIICTPQSPSCLMCPVREHCHAFHEGVQRELPVKSKKKKPKQVTMAAVVLKDKEGHYFIHKRNSSGLLANLWEFPNCETSIDIVSQKEQLVAYLRDEYEAEAVLEPLTGTIQHVFSHLVWNISVYTGKLNPGSSYKNLVKVTEEEMQRYAFPVSHQKIYQMSLGQTGKQSF